MNRTSEGLAGVRAVVFDLDDTLFDHRGSTRRALARWWSTLGVPDDPSLVEAWFAIEEQHFDAWRAGAFSFAEQRRRRLRDFLPLVGHPVPPSDDDLDAAFAGYLHWYETSWRAFPDVRPAVDALTARPLVLAVLTNGTRVQQHAKVRAIGLAGDLAAVLTSEELGVAKPAPEAYLSVCRRLGLEPGEVVHVGDRHDLDVVAAREAGLHALHLDRDRRRVEPPDGRLDSLAELVGRLRPPAEP